MRVGAVVRIPEARRTGAIDRDDARRTFRDHLDRAGTRPRPQDADTERPREDAADDAPTAGQPLVTIHIPPLAPASAAEPAAVAPIDEAAPVLDAATELPPALAHLLTAATTAPATPLEQAIQDLLRDLDEPAPPPEGELEAPPPALGPSVASVDAGSDGPAPAAASTRGTSEPPAAAPPRSHVHLVLDDPTGERVVVTVAVRGSDVHVNLRASDDAAASLARNAATLDHALRLRGLDLADLDVQREPPRDPPHEPERERPRHDQPTFTLDEVA